MKPKIIGLAVVIFSLGAAKVMAAQRAFGWLVGRFMDGDSGEMVRKYPETSPSPIPAPFI